MRAFFLFFSLFTALSLQSQIYQPVKWDISLSPAGGDQYLFKAKATIDEGWWVYSQHLENEDGPIATTVNFDPGDHYSLVGKNKESDNAKKIFDKVFAMELVKFQKHYTIEQKIKVTDPTKPITGYLNYMTCDDERCLPPTDVEYSLMATAGSGGDASSAPSGKPAPGAEKKAETKEKTGSTASAEKKKVDKSDSAVAETEAAATETNSDFSNIQISGIDAPTQTGSSPGILRPAKWTFRSEKRSDDTYAVIAEATIDEGWHTYGLDDNVEDGPVPTTYVINADDLHSPEGEVLVESSQRIEEYDVYFDMQVVKFKHDLKLTQIIKTSQPGIITGFLEFMVCYQSKCLAPEFIDIRIDLTTGKMVSEEETTAGLTVDENGFVDQRNEHLIESYASPVSDCGETPEQESGNLLWMFIFGMINGFVALLTPCVFPMIPLTVSFFTKDTKRKGWENGLWYGASIITLYVVLGLLITILFGAGSLNELSTNPIANTIFFIIFVLFAFSFFGFYEITLPSSWSNKSDAMADKGGLIGIFFMAATLAIVSFSCTGPLIGTALVEASSEGFLGPLVVMGGFSLALAIPFSLFAAFPAWLNSLPKSGGWMNSVKVMLGFAELALALKFLSIADMTAHWGVLKYELFMGLWVIIALAMAAYMFGWIRFPHDSPNRRITPTTGTIGALFAIIGIYLATGLLGSEKTGTYNSLGLMSGLAPPAHYNFFKPLGDVDEAYDGKYASLSKCANNFDCFHDYYEGVSYAKEKNKPILLDFTGYGCVNCRKTEEHIWSVDVIREKINEEFVLISLYVDDKNSLEPVLRSAVTNQRIRTVGQKWTDFQVVNFEQNSQPLYVIMSPDETVLTAPRGYDPDVDAYESFLECGLNAFKELSGSPAIGSAE